MLMCIFLCVWVSFGLSLVGCVGAALDPEAFVRRRYHASAKVGDYIYIDGGEISWIDSTGKVQIQPSQHTYSLDLSTSWTNSTVTLRELSRGSAPLLNHRALWVDDSASTLHAYGGELSWLTNELPQPLQAWKFIADGQGGGQWTQGKVTSDSDYASLVHPASGSHTYGNGVGYWFGGHLGEKTWPRRDWYPVSGLVTYNMSSNTWSNLSTAGYGEHLVTHHSVAHFVPDYGDAGLMLWMGGIDSSDTAITDSDPPRSLSTITMYDPKSGKWFHQRATGTVPEWRTRACAVGVKGENRTYEIFLHGGSNFPVYGGAYPTPHDIALGNALDEVYVLTLPAFTWFKANYTPSTSRQSHTCHVVGNRQLLAIGGADPVVQEYYALAAKNSTDPWKQGLGVFDMTEMKWTEGFDARADAYGSPDVVRQWYRDNPRYPRQWDSLDLGKLFGDKTASINATNTNTPNTPSPTNPKIQPSPPINHPSTPDPQKTPPVHDSKSKANSGVIAGAVIAVIIGIALICTLIVILCIRRKRQRNEKVKKTTEKAMELESTSRAELANDQKEQPVELDCEQYYEMGS